MVIQIDHRLVVISGLFVACLYYPVPFYILIAVVVVGFAVYFRNNELTWPTLVEGWRMPLGLTGSAKRRDNETVRRWKPRQNRFPSNSMTPNGPSPLSKLSRNGDNPIGHSVSPLDTCRTKLWGQNVCSSTPVFRFDYANYGNRIRTKSQLSPGEMQSTPSYSRPLASNSPSFHFKPSNLHDIGATGSAGSRMDSSSVAKAEPSYNAVCQTNYAGIGIYPTIHLEPQRPLALSSSSSAMMRNRVTVKVAPLPKPVSPHFRSNNVMHQQLPIALMGEGHVMDVVQGLTRKRPILDGCRGIKKRQRKEQSDVIGSSLVAFEHSVGIHPKIDSHHSDESMQVSQRSCDESPKSHKQPAIIARSGIDAITSSYSSSAMMIKQQEQKAKSDRRGKRKLESAAVEAPKGKISRSKPHPESPPKNDTNPDNDVVLTENSDVIEEQTAVAKVEQKPKQANKPTEFYPALAGTKSPMPTYVPSYIPSMSDYLEDQKSDRNRLHKMLNCLSSKTAKQDKSSTSGSGQIKMPEVESAPVEPSATSPPSGASVTVSTSAAQPAPSSSAPMPAFKATSQPEAAAVDSGSNNTAISPTTAASAGSSNISAPQLPAVAPVPEVVSSGASFVPPPQLAAPLAHGVKSVSTSSVQQFSTVVPSSAAAPTLTNSVESPISSIPSEQSSLWKSSGVKPTLASAPFTSLTGSSPAITNNAMLLTGAPVSTPPVTHTNSTIAGAKEPAAAVTISSSAIVTSALPETSATSAFSQPTFTFGNPAPQLRPSSSSPFAFGAAPTMTSSVQTIPSVSTTSLFAFKSSPSIATSSTNSFAAVSSPSTATVKAGNPAQQSPSVFGQGANTTNNFSFVPPLVPPPPAKPEVTSAPSLFQFGQPVPTTTAAQKSTLMNQNAFTFGGGAAKPAGDGNSDNIGGFQFNFGASSGTSSFGTNGGMNYPAPSAGFGSSTSHPFGSGNSISGSQMAPATTQQPASNTFSFVGNSAASTTKSSGFPTFTYTDNGSNNTFKFGQLVPPTETAAPPVNNGFNFNPTFKPTFNFVPNSAPAESTPMFSIGSSSTAPRRITRPGSKYRPKS